MQISVVNWENQPSKLKMTITLNREALKLEKYLIIFHEIWTEKVVDGLPNAE